MPSVTNTAPFDQRDGFRLDTYQPNNQSRPFKKRPIDALCQWAVFIFRSDTGVCKLICIDDSQ
jgi:hypothetical protein